MATDYGGVALRQESSSNVSGGHIQQTELQLKECGRKVTVDGGCFHRTNFVIRNTQGVKLTQYLYYQNLVAFFILYAVCSLPMAFLHIGVAIEVMVIDIVWLSVFAQYLRVVKKVIPIVLLHPVSPSLQGKVNAILEFQLVCIEGRYVCKTTNESVGLQVGDVELEYNQVHAAGMVHLTATGSKFKFQVLSPETYRQVEMTQNYSIFLFLAAGCHFVYALICLIGVLIASDGGASSTCG